RQGGVNLSNQRYIPVKDLRKFTINILKKAGLRTKDATFFGDVLIQANMEGVDSHGVSKLPVYYKRLIQKRMDAKPKIKYRNSKKGTILVDGNNGAGPVVMRHTIRKILKTIKKTGICVASVKHSNHLGSLSYYNNIFSAKGFVS